MMIVGIVVIVFCLIVIAEYQMKISDKLDKNNKLLKEIERQTKRNADLQKKV